MSKVGQKKILTQKRMIHFFGSKLDYDSATNLTGPR
jgi:hypothetical protein